MCCVLSLESPLFLLCFSVLPCHVCLLALPQKHLQMQYLPILMCQFSKVIFNYASVDSALDGRLLSSCLRWKHGKMLVCEKDCVCMIQLVCKFSEEYSSGWVYIPQINSLTACTSWLPLLRYALLMVAVIFRRCWMFAASAQNMLQHNLHAFFSFQSQSFYSFGMQQISERVFSLIKVFIYRFLTQSQFYLPCDFLFIRASIFLLPAWVPKSQQLYCDNDLL